VGEVARARTEVGGDRLLKYAALLYLAALVVHNGDHLRRGTETLTPG
jgi:hypothetical protein